MGIDVGGRRKGFHAAALDKRGLVAGPSRLSDVAALLDWVGDLRPDVIAVDSPRTCAAPGDSCRPEERALSRAICGIRWTPEESKLEGNRYYEWVICGCELYEALEREQERRGWEVIEVFPTASWTVWSGSRGKQTRARWSRLALEGLGLRGLPSRRLNQDDRDALAAGVTGMLHAQGKTRKFGEIVVPVSGEGSLAAGGGSLNVAERSSRSHR